MTALSSLCFSGLDGILCFVFSMWREIGNLFTCCAEYSSIPSSVEAQVNQPLSKYVFQAEPTSKLLSTRLMELSSSNGGGHVQQLYTMVYFNLRSSFRQQETSKPNQINVPFFFLVSCQLILGIIHLPDHDLFRITVAAIRIDGSAREVIQFTFFPRFYRLAGKLATFHRPGLNHSDVTVDHSCRRKYSTVHSRSASQSNAAARAIRGRARRTDGNYAKRLLSRRSDGRRITLSTSRRWRPSSALSPHPDPPRSFVAAKGTILQKFSG